MLTCIGTTAMVKKIAEQAKNKELSVEWGEKKDTIIIKDINKVVYRAIQKHPYTTWLVRYDETYFD